MEPLNTADGNAGGASSFWFLLVLEMLAVAVNREMLGILMVVLVELQLVEIPISQVVMDNNGQDNMLTNGTDYRPTWGLGSAHPIGEVAAEVVFIMLLQ